jgi:hypothetical protein
MRYFPGKNNSSRGVDDRSTGSEIRPLRTLQ